LGVSSSSYEAGKLMEVEARVSWQGQGSRLLFVPGWNTPAWFLQQAIPSWFLKQWSCGVVEWPGMGSREMDVVPQTMEDLLGELDSASQAEPLAGVVGFCLGGVVAWEWARRRSALSTMLIMVESPYHFPLVLAPLLMPKLGQGLFRLFTKPRLGRALVEKCLFPGSQSVAEHFWSAFGDTSPAAAQAYLKILKQFERQLPLVPLSPGCACHRLQGAQTPKLLKYSWGSRHAIQATERVLNQVSHFPVLEAPEELFNTLHELVLKTKSS
jgi:pimeloyl-ACP methyl ester carboxylesterase